MRTFLLKGLLILAAITVGAVYACAATDVQQASSKAVAANQSAKPVTAAAVDGQSDKKNTSSNAPDETIKIQTNILPARVAAVSGDYHKYEAMSWQNRGYSGGIDDLAINYTSGDDVTIDAGGNGIVGNGDYKGYYSLKKKDVGYVDIDFKQFRKYYDTYGGMYQGLSRSLSRDLFLDIGHFGIEAGITMPDLPNISVYYDHSYKNGAKSTLEWASMTGAIPTRKICPAWKEINESVDTLGIKGDYTEKGYHLSGDQRWEVVSDKTHGYQVAISTATGLGDQIRQNLTSDTTLMTTTLGADKWYLNDKVFTSSAYRFEHLKNGQAERRVTFNSSGRLTGITTPNADAQNRQTVNSWVMNLMVSPWAWLNGTGGFKAEANMRDGRSYLPSTATSNLQTNATSNTSKFAEFIGVRFKAIPRTAVYSDLSFEQSQNRFSEYQQQLLATPNPMSRDAIIHEPVITWTTGADVQPVRFINLASQVRLREKDMDFTEGYRIRPFSELAFLANLHTTNMGFTQRATANLSSWAQASFRYMYDNTDYTTRQLYEKVDEKANMLSNTFVYDVSVYPLSNLSMTGSFTERHDATKTLGAASKGFMQPAFTSNFYTWTFSTDYQPRDKVSLDGTLFYTVANNYGNFQNYNPASQVYYGSDYNLLGLTVSCKLDIKKDLSVTPQYGYQFYRPNETSGIGGGFDAQIFSVALTANWG